MDIQKRQADRLFVMKAIFDASNGSESELVRVLPTFETSLGLSQREVVDACRYLMGQGLITAPMKADDIIVGVQITHRGIQEMEQSLLVPEEPTSYFPPALSVINIHGGGNVIQNSSPGARQEVTVGTFDLAPIHVFLSAYDSNAANLGLDGPAADELAAEIATVRAQVSSPRPKKQIIRSSLTGIRTILEGVGGNLAAVGLLELLQHIHF